MPARRKQVVKKKAPMVKRRRARPIAKKTGARRRVVKQTESKLRAQLLNILTVPNFYSFSVGEQHVTPTASATLGMGQVYFVPGITANAIPLMTQSPNYYQVVANLIDTAVQQSLKFHVTEQEIKMRFVSQSNAPSTLVRYTCVARDRISTSNSYINPLNVLGQGFSNEQIDNGNPNSNNAGLSRTDLTPFQSSTFVELFKIAGVKKYHLKPGKEIQMSLIDKRSHTVHPEQFVNMAGSVNIGGGTLQYSYLRGSTFYLFALTGSVADDSASSTHVTATAPVLDSIITYKLTYKYMSDDNKTYSVSNATGIYVPTHPQVMGLYTSTNESNA